MLKQDLQELILHRPLGTIFRVIMSAVLPTGRLIPSTSTSLR